MDANPGPSSAPYANYSSRLLDTVNSVLDTTVGATLVRQTSRTRARSGASSVGEPPVYATLNPLSTEVDDEVEEEEAMEFNYDQLAMDEDFSIPEDELTEPFSEDEEDMAQVTAQAGMAENPQAEAQGRKRRIVDSPSAPRRPKLVCSRAKTTAPLQPELQDLLGLANMNLAAGKVEEGLSMVREVIRQRPLHAGPFEVLSHFYDNPHHQKEYLSYSMMAADLKRSFASGEEWEHLGDLAVGLQEYQKAIVCFQRASRFDPCNFELYRKRWEVQDQQDEKDAAYLTRLRAVQAMEKEGMANHDYVRLCREVAKYFYSTNRTRRPITAWLCLLRRLKHCGLPTSYEDLFHICEVLTQPESPQGNYEEAVDLMVEYGNVKIECSGHMSVAGTPCRVEVPPDFPVDLQVKLCIALINGGYNAVYKPLLDQLLAKFDMNTEGDLFLEIAKALHGAGHDAQAQAVTQQLLDSDNFASNEAVCLLSVDLRARGVDGDRDLLEILRDAHSRCPGSTEVRVRFARQLWLCGFEQESIGALSTISHRDIHLSQTDTLDSDRIYYERCIYLLETMRQQQNEADESLYQQLEHSALRFCGLYFKKPVPVRTYFKLLSDKTGVTISKIILSCTELVELDTEIVTIFNAITPEICAAQELKYSGEKVYDIYAALARLYARRHRWLKLFTLSVFAYNCPALAGAQLVMKLAGPIGFSSIYAGLPEVAYDIYRSHLCEQNATRVWNFFALFFQRGHAVRTTRYIVRKAQRDPGNFRILSLLNGHGSLSTGTLNHALLEYSYVLKESPDNPLLWLLFGVIHIAWACRRFTKQKRKMVNIAIGFLDKYRRLRETENEAEVCFNIGRAFHQVGLYPAAIKFYKRVLEDIEVKQKRFDLRPHAAHNLARMYEATGNKALARTMLFTYCVV